MLIFLQMIETEYERSKFGEIYYEYKSLMFSVALKYLGNVQDAEDAVQHVFMKIAENIKKIDPVCPKTRNLVVLMTEHRAIDLIRSRNRRAETELAEDCITLPPPAMGENVLADCINSLPEKQRMVIWLKYSYGYSLKEIAVMLDMSLAAAQKTDQRAKKKLEELYAKAMEDLD